MMNLHRKQLFLFITIFALLLIVVGCGSGQSPDPNQGTAPSGEQAQPQKEQAAEFKIAVIPVQTEGEMDVAMKKLTQVLSEKLNRKVTINVYPDYNGVVEAMNYDQVDMAYFGPLTYVIAHHQSGAEAIITQLIDGEPFYYSYIITHVDNPWNSIEDLLKDPGQVSFAFGDPNSTSGSLIPGIELKNRGVYTDEMTYQFESVTFTGSHDVTALAIQNKEVDAGAIDSAIFNSLVKGGTVDGSQFKTIWQSDELFQYPWAVKKGTDDETIRLLREAFVAIKDEEILRAFGASGFVEASNDDYEAIRAAAEQEGRLN